MKALGRQRAGLGFLSGRMMEGTLGILSQLMGGRAKEARRQAGLGWAQEGSEPSIPLGPIELALPDKGGGVLNCRRGGGAPPVSQD